MANFDNAAMAKANRTLALVKREMAGVRGDVNVDPYKNGRERGWLLTRGRVAVAFAEYRRSDDVVVYVGRPEEFEPGGNVPSEAAWEGRRFFPSPKEAALFIAPVLVRATRRRAGGR